jgi:hypothetical protein
MTEPVMKMHASVTVAAMGYNPGLNPSVFFDAETEGKTFEGPSPESVLRQASEWLREQAAEVNDEPAETHSEETLFKVARALRSLDMTDEFITDAISAMQNAGILFRERLG